MERISVSQANMEEFIETKNAWINYITCHYAADATHQQNV